ncbi:MAG: FkbM family methyltransferase [Pseudomonadota bacterium]
MNELFSVKPIDSLHPLLVAFQKANINLGNLLDGGAGSGNVAKHLLHGMAPKTKCYAFEPFPGNHRFFENLKENIILVPKALAEREKIGRFYVRQTVSENSKWANGKLSGYSSIGFLTDCEDLPGDYFDVPCVRADEELPEDANIGVIKLDLQGGELNALKGMTRLLPSVALMWVEFSGQKGLIDFIEDNDFMVFDTPYLFLGDPTDEAERHFNVLKKDMPLSTGKTAWTGLKRKSWKRYDAEFAEFRKTLNLIQTDLVCVNKSRIDDFIKALSFL